MQGRSPGAPGAPDAIKQAIAEARRRLGISDRDVSSSVEHFAAVVRPVCADWGLTAERWLDGGAGMPTLAVSSVDSTSGVLKISQPGALDAADVSCVPQPAAAT